MLTDLNTIYRFVVNNIGIYEAVEQACPRTDPRRQNKPNGAWLPKVGQTYPGAISFWTSHGLQKYIVSNLMAWHASVVEDPVTVITTHLPEHVLYSDPYQIICHPTQIHPSHQKSLPIFLNQLNHKPTP